MMAEEDGDDAEEGQKEKDDEGDESVAGDALFITHRTESLDAAGSEITDELGIGGGGASKVAAEPPEKSRQIVFADAKVVVVLGGGDGLVAILEAAKINFLENGFVGCGMGRRGRGGFGLVGDGGAVRQSGRAEARMGFAFMEARIELFDLGFEAGDFVA